MKDVDLSKFIFTVLIAVALFCCGETSAQQWSNGYVNSYRHMFSVRINPDHTVNGFGGFPFANISRTVCRISDYGRNWYNYEIVIDESTPGLQASHYLTDDLAVAVGFRGTVLRTEDMGVSWDSIPCDTMFDLRAVHFAGTDVGFAVGGDSTLQTQAIYRSSDVGNTWQQVRNASGFTFRAVHALNSMDAIAVGDSGLAMVTADGGDSWQPLALPLVRHWHDVQFTDPLNGIIVGGNFERRTILRSTDGGETWSVLMDESGGMLRDVSFIDGTYGHTVGYGGEFLSTEDGGASWNMGTVPGITTDDNLYTVHFLSQDYGIAMGEWGRFFMFTDFLPPDVVTGEAAVESGGNVRFNGFVDTKGSSSQPYVVFSTDPGLNDSDSLIAQTMLSTGLEQFTVESFGLLDNTTYYYACMTDGISGSVSGDTLSVYVDYGEGVSVQTVPATDITGTSATLNGLVNNLNAGSTLWFDYQRFGGPLQTVAANPPVVSDGQQYLPTAQLTGLETDNTYRFRLRVASGQSTFHGSYSQFQTGTQSTIIAQPATEVTLNSATLHGTVSNLHLPSTLSFQYGRVGTTEFFNVDADPNEIADVGTYQIMAEVAGLIPNNWYWFTLQVQNEFGNLNGTFQEYFFTGNPEAVVTDPATGVSGTTAVLRGRVNEVIALPASVWFEYSTFGGSVTTVEAIPAQITANGPQSVHATLGGLSADEVYRFRIKVVDDEGNEYHGQYRQAHTGQNFIPNHSFEDWTPASGERADDWIHVFGPPQKLTPGHVGNHAVKIEFFGLDHISGLLNGFLQPTQDGVQFSGGVPFSTRPDTLAGMFNYNIMPGDSALVMIFFRKQGEVISEQFLKLGGGSGGEWTELKFPITYLTEDVPDTLVLGFIPVNLLSEEALPQLGSFLMIDDLHFTGNHAPIPNGGFEDWASFSFISPDDWFFDDMLRFGYYLESADQAVSRTADAMHGNYAAELVNLSAQEVTDMAVEGLYLNGRLSTSGSYFKGEPSFALPHVPQALHGYYKFFPDAGDTLTVQCTLFNNATPVGEGFLHITQTAAEFTPFTLDLLMYDNAAPPDSAMIEVKNVGNWEPAGGPSRSVIDNLRFDGFAEDFGVVVGAPAPAQTDGIELQLYPNPGTEYLTFQVNGTIDGEYELELFDVMGRMVLSRSGRSSGARQQSQTVDISHLPVGVYFAILFSGTVRHAGKWVKQ